ncbi:SagB family peptide dehydrogenase [Clostridium fallax]|uniref:SagB-type dehydrogenase domain-containing protein n=1 Tax=Clostridium fallax TaxID=1533 RepID=A0A1M4Y5L4_9CLOT|nr:SagB family peptide dehydrogenase [Clostridium fallax]SHF00969.1 SagB-type dehydrogenase domain-containing protein [Clostridium fallax]SQB07471.1 streptolysin associated protein SagB [Clostridium fallax]
MFKRKKENKDKKDNGSRYPYEMQIISFNTQYCSMSTYADSTVMKTPDTVLKGNLYSKENRFLSEEYLLNYRTNNENLGFRAGLSSFFQQNAALTAANKALEEEIEDIINLPKAKNIKASLGATISLRRSVRKYKNNIMSIQDLSNLLYYGQGISGEIEFKNNLGCSDNIKLRNNPSAGGLYPINLYIYISKVKGLDDGIYLYYPYSHSLKPVNLKLDNIDKEKFAEFSNITSKNINVFFIYVYNMYINSRKYGDAGAAFAFIESGEIAQNIQLTATAIGYGSCDIGGYDKQYLEKVLKLDGITNHVIHMTIIGKEGE